MSSNIPPTEPPTAKEMQDAREQLNQLRESLIRKREQLAVREEATGHLKKQSDVVRLEIFQLEDQILDLQLSMIARALASGYPPLTLINSPAANAAAATGGPSTP